VKEAPMIVQNYSMEKNMRLNSFYETIHVSEKFFNYSINSTMISDHESLQAEQSEVNTEGNNLQKRIYT